MGCSLSVRDLVGERTIFQRERAVGLLPHAYLLAKIVVFCICSLLQAAVLVTIVVLGKGAPDSGSLLPPGAMELYVDIAVLACASVLIGLLFSALARSNEQIMPMLVVMIMGSLVMCGGMIPVTGRVALEQLSWLFPARWGYAATASTADVKSLFRGAQDDNLWEHSAGWWSLDVAMMIVISIVLAIATWRMLVLKKR
jgi:ABC-type transport system involved in multi-copper enzyme maturation permease subunit